MAESAARAEGEGLPAPLLPELPEQGRAARVSGPRPAAQAIGGRARAGSARLPGRGGVLWERGGVSRWQRELLIA